MKHLKEACYKTYLNTHYRDSNGNQEFFGSNGNSLHVTMQDGPISEVGENGIQVTELLGLVKEIYVSLNKAFPCRENSLTITKIEEAIHWQDARTKDREARKVEGKSEA